MALNKFMHPRNIYKNPPDFAKLAISYEDFANIAKTVNLIYYFCDKSLYGYVIRYILCLNG